MRIDLRWHTEDPPNERDAYLVQYEDGDMDVAVWSDVNRFWPSLKTDWHWVGTMQYAEVVAWYPLPYPYENTAKRLVVDRIESVGIYDKETGKCIAFWEENE